VITLSKERTNDVVWMLRYRFTTSKQHLPSVPSQWAKSPKSSLQECIFDNMAL